MLLTYLTGGTDYLKPLVKYLPIAGIVFFIVDLIAMLKNLNSPELLSPVALAIALLPIMHGNLVAVFIKTVQPEQCKGNDSGGYGYGYCYAALNFAVIAFSFVVLGMNITSGAQTSDPFTRICLL